MEVVVVDLVRCLSFDAFYWGVYARFQVLGQFFDDQVILPARLKVPTCACC